MGIKSDNITPTIPITIGKISLNLVDLSKIKSLFNNFNYSFTLYKIKENYMPEGKIVKALSGFY
ncbi:TPA: hypothetical protein ACJWO2_002073, partial [Streptococcus pneumoniae]